MELLSFHKTSLITFINHKTSLLIGHTLFFGSRLIYSFGILNILYRELNKTKKEACFAMSQIGTFHICLSVYQ